LLSYLCCDGVPPRRNPLSHFLFYSLAAPRDPPSFPTRRSSDLPERPEPVRRQPQRRQRVLHLVRHPPRHLAPDPQPLRLQRPAPDRRSTRLNSSHVKISYAVFCLKKKKTATDTHQNTPGDSTEV